MPAKVSGEKNPLTMMKMLRKQKVEKNTGSKSLMNPIVGFSFIMVKGKSLMLKFLFIIFCSDENEILRKISGPWRSGT